MTMQHRYIAKANDPLWIQLKAGEVELVNNACHPVTRSHAKNALYLRIIKHHLQIIGSFFVGGREIRRGISGQGAADAYLIPPITQTRYAFADVVFSTIS